MSTLGARSTVPARLCTNVLPWNSLTRAAQGTALGCTLLWRLLTPDIWHWAVTSTLIWPHTRTAQAWGLVPAATWLILKPDGLRPGTQTGASTRCAPLIKPGHQAQRWTVAMLQPGLARRTSSGWHWTIATAYCGRMPGRNQAWRTMTQLRWTSAGRQSWPRTVRQPPLAYRRTAQAGTGYAPSAGPTSPDELRPGTGLSRQPPAADCGRRLAAGLAQHCSDFPYQGVGTAGLCTSTLRWRLARTAQAQHGLCTSTLRHMARLRSTAWRAHTSLVPGCRESCYTETHTWETLVGGCAGSHRGLRAEPWAAHASKPCQPWGPRSTCQ
jgi:hypothetical protein